jgi:transmembrane sensor
MKQSLPASLLSKYLSGQCTPHEEALIEEWYASFENDANYTDTISEQQKQQIKATIRQRIAVKQKAALPVKAQGRVRSLVWAATGIAASLLVLFGVLRLEHPAVKNVIVTNASITLTNITNTIAETTLSDGSHVWMMPGAVLKYHKYFSGNCRELNLSGEAFFEVTKNPARPFIIYSRNLITKVWGTSFRVRDSRYLKFADVTVMTGKVSVRLTHSEGFTKNPDARNPADEVMIYPLQQVTYLKKDQLFQKKPKADMEAMSIWKKPDISFNNEPLRDVIPVLNKTFNLNITASDNNINNLLLTADLTGLNFPQIMQMLHKALDIDYTINGPNVLLKTN